MLLRLELNENNEILWRAEDKKLVNDWLDSRKVRYIEVDFKNAQSLKSLQQLGYIWGVIFPVLSKELGYGVDEIYLVYKNKFLKDFVTIGEKEVLRIKGLSDLNMKETSEFIEKIIIHAETELGIIVPEAEKFNQQYKPYANI